MHEIERRALLKVAAAGRVAFSVDGVDVPLTPRAARAQDVPLRTLSAGTSRDARCRRRDARARRRQPASPICPSADIDSRRGGACCRPSNSACGPLTPISIAHAPAALNGASERLNGGRASTQLSETEQRSLVDNMRQNKVEGWQGPASLFVYRAAQRCGRCRGRDHGWLMPTSVSQTPPISPRRKSGDEVEPWRTRK